MAAGRPRRAKQAVGVANSLHPSWPTRLIAVRTESAKDSSAIKNCQRLPVTNSLLRRHNDYIVPGHADRLLVGVQEVTTCLVGG